MGALENSTSNNHSSVGSSSDKCAFSNSGDSAENITKKNVQEFNYVLSNPCKLSRQTLHCLNLKLPSHLNKGVLKKGSLKMSLMKIFCL